MCFVIGLVPNIRKTDYRKVSGLFNQIVEFSTVSFHFVSIDIGINNLHVLTMFWFNAIIDLIVLKAGNVGIYTLS